MDPISRLNRLMETLRQQMTQSTKRVATPRQDTASNTARAQTPRQTVSELRQQIRTRVRAIAPNSPDRDRQVRRIFFESVLAWEFGEQLLLDSQFNRLIEGIEEAFEQDSETDRELRNVLTDLARTDG